MLLWIVDACGSYPAAGHDYVEIHKLQEQQICRVGFQIFFIALLGFFAVFIDDFLFAGRQ